MKSLKKIGLAVMTTAMLLGFASCGNNTAEPPHEHTFATEWTSNTTHHWHAATCEHTNEVSDKAEHTFGELTIANGTGTKKCSVCGYVFLVGPVLKAGSNHGDEFQKALKDNLGVKANYSDANVTKVVFGLLSDDAIKAKVATLTKKTDIGDVDGTCYAYAEPDGVNLIIYIVPADEKAAGFVFNEDSSSMFYCFEKCTEIAGLNLVDTSKVTDMVGLFGWCSSLTAIDLSKFDTSKVTEMDSMFSACSALTALDVSNFDTSNVVSMNSMFCNCSGLTALDVSKFDTSNVTSMFSMFCNCSGLTALDVSKFDTSKVFDMQEMFYGCSGLTALDVSKFDTSNVTSMGSMFCNCSGLTALDVSGFDTSKVTYMSHMFKGCTNLEKIYIKDDKTLKGAENCTKDDWVKGCAKSENEIFVTK